MLNFTFLGEIFKIPFINYFDAPRRDESIGTKISKIGWHWAKLWQSKLCHKKYFLMRLIFRRVYLFYLLTKFLLLGTKNLLRVLGIKQKKN